MTLSLPAPLWGLKLALEEYPAMPVAGWGMLSVGGLLLLLVLFVRGTRFSGLLAALSLMLYWPALYVIHWYLFNYLGDPEEKRLPGPLEVSLGMTPGALAQLDYFLLYVFGTLGGLFFLCMLESLINYRRKPRLEPRGSASEDNPFGAPPVAQPAPAPRPAAARPQAQPRPAAPSAVPPAKKPVKKPGSPPTKGGNPFEFG